MQFIHTVLLAGIIIVIALLSLYLIKNQLGINIDDKSHMGGVFSTWK